MRLLLIVTKLVAVPHTTFCEQNSSRSKEPMIAEDDIVGTRTKGNPFLPCAS